MALFRSRYLQGRPVHYASIFALAFSPLSCLLETVETEVITHINDDECEMTRGSYGNPSGYTNVWWRCDGVMGWEGVWNDYDTGEGFGFTSPDGTQSGLLGFSQDDPNGYLDREIIWLLRDARPYAALMGFTERDTNLRRVYTIALQEQSDPSACIIASFEDNQDPQLEEAARIAATMMAWRWTCGVDAPVHLTAADAEETPYFTAIQYVADPSRRPHMEENRD